MPHSNGTKAKIGPTVRFPTNLPAFLSQPRYTNPLIQNEYIMNFRHILCSPLEGLCSLNLYTGGAHCVRMQLQRESHKKSHIQRISKQTEQGLRGTGVSCPVGIAQMTAS